MPSQLLLRLIGRRSRLRVAGGPEDSIGPRGDIRSGHTDCLPSVEVRHPIAAVVAASEMPSVDGER